MLSAALSGLLRVGAVTLTAAGIGAGVYSLAQAGQGEDANREARATVTAPAPGETATAAVLGTPQPAPPEIDTSDWATYDSPLGFTIKHPPTWVAESTDIPSLPAGRALIMNEKAQEARALGMSEKYLGGEAWIQIAPDPFPTYDVDSLFAACGHGGEQEASEVTFAGMEAVRCGPKDLTIASSGPSTVGEVYWVRLPSGRPLHISWQAVDADATTVALLRAALATTVFDTP